MDKPAPERPASRWADKPTSYSLLEGALDGDSACWFELERIYRPFIRDRIRILLTNRCVWSDADLDDVMQNVFLALHERLLREFRTRGVGAFRAYLRRITSLQLMSWAKKRKVWAQKGRSLQFPADVAPDELLDLAERLADSESEAAKQWERVEEEFLLPRFEAELERRCQNPPLSKYLAMYRCKLAGLTYREIAEHFQEPRSTVFRAIVRITEILAAIRREYGFEDERPESRPSPRRDPDDDSEGDRKN